jgi:hypothetical protein
MSWLILFDVIGDEEVYKGIEVGKNSYRLLAGQEV